MIERVCAWLRELAPKELDRLPCAGIVVAIDRDPYAKVTMLLVDEGGQPCAVAKTTRDASSDSALAAEYAALARIASLPPTNERSGVPVPVALQRLGYQLVLVTTALAGAPLTVGYYTPGHVTDAAAVRRDFEAAGGWLARFQASTVSTSSMLDAAGLRLLEAAAGRYRQRVGWTDQDAAVFNDLDADMAALPASRVRLGIVHGDYAIGNLLSDRRDGSGISGVIDWELSEPEGLPIKDVLKFAASYSSFLDRAEPARRGRMRGHPGWERALQRWPSPPGWGNLTGFMYGFFGEGWYPDLVRDFVATHADRLGVPRAALPVLLRAFVLEQASAIADATYAHGYRSLHDAMSASTTAGRVLVGQP